MVAWAKLHADSDSATIKMGRILASLKLHPLLLQSTDCIPGVVLGPALEVYQEMDRKRQLLVIAVRIS